MLCWSAVKCGLWCLEALGTVGYVRAWNLLRLIRCHTRSWHCALHHGLPQAAHLGLMNLKTCRIFADLATFADCTRSRLSICKGRFQKICPFEALILPPSRVPPGVFLFRVLCSVVGVLPCESCSLGCYPLPPRLPSLRAVTSSPVVTPLTGLSSSLYLDVNGICHT